MWMTFHPEWPTMVKRSTLGIDQPPVWAPHWEKLVHSARGQFKNTSLPSSLISAISQQYCKTSLRRQHHPEEAKAKYDTVDDKLGDIMEKAEETCASPWKASLWSKQLKAAYLLVRYWKARKSQIKAKRSMTIILNRLRQEIESLSLTHKDGSQTPIDDDDGTRTKQYMTAQMRKATTDLHQKSQISTTFRNLLFFHSILYFSYSNLTCLDIF
jgi:hypothetical protein